MDTYGHPMEDTNHEATKRLGAAIFGDNGSKMVAKKELLFEKFAHEKKRPERGSALRYYIR